MAYYWFTPSKKNKPRPRHVVAVKVEVRLPSNPEMVREEKQLPSPPPEDAKSSPYATSKHAKGASSSGSSNGSSSLVKRLASSGSATSNGQVKRTTYGSTTNGLKKVDPNDDLLILLLAQRALADSQDCNILSSEEVDELKNERQLVESMIESTKRKLKLEQKVKQAAQSLYRLETAANKRQRVDTPAAASAHLDTAQKKCDEINTELWKLSASCMEIERRLSNHNAAVLGLRMNILEKNMENGTTDDFGEGHLYVSNDNEDRSASRRSSTRLSMSERTPPRRIATPPRRISAPPREIVVPPPEFNEAQRRLRELNFQVASMTQPDIQPPTSASENILSLIESLDTHIRRLADSHTVLTRDLQTSLSESQRMIEQLKLRERDQSAAIADHTVRTEDLDRRLVHTQREFDRVQNELEEQDAVIQDLRQEVQTAREEARIAETAIQGREAESLRREKSLRRNESERFTSELTHKDSTIADLTQNLTHLQRQLDDSDSQTKSLETKLQDQSREHDVLIRELETQLVMLKSETAMLKAEKDEILGSRQQRAQEAKMQRELELQREKLSRNSHPEDLLLAEIESLKDNNAHLTRALDRAQSEHLSKQDSLTQEIASLQRELSMASAQQQTGHRGTSSYGSSNYNDEETSSARERELESRCRDLQDELTGILDDFERLTSQFIDHESFRSTLEAQVDALRAQCHALQTELAEEKMRVLGQRGNNDNSSPVQGGGGGGGSGQTSTVTLRAEFRKMVSELRNEHIAALKSEYDERRRLEGIIREMKKENDREKFGKGK